MRGGSIRMHMFPAVLCLVASVTTVAAENLPEQTPLRVHLELDHASIAVMDLAASGAAYQRLGFTLKPGHPHANSISNLHAKFLDATEVELITASEPRDDLASEYLKLIGQGDGGAFVALRSGRIDSIAARLTRAGHATVIKRTDGPRSISFPSDHALRTVWFLEVLRPWIDRAEYTAHANGGSGLRAVWLSSRIASALEPLLATLGYAAQPHDWPIAASRVVNLDAGEIYIVPLDSGLNGRSLVGVTIAVQSLGVVEDVLHDADVEFSGHTDLRGSSLLVRPLGARGIWLEFLEAPAPQREIRDANERNAGARARE